MLEEGQQLARTRGRTAALVLLVLGLLFLLDVVAMHTLFTSELPGANDFYPRWRGAQLFWQEGLNPYDEEVTDAIQMGIRGRLSRPDEDQLAFAYPFYVVFLLLPFVFLPYPWAQAAWMVIIQFALAGGVILYLKTLRWRLSPALFALTMLWAIVVYNSLRTILLGQFAGLVFLAMAATLWALQARRDGLAAVCLLLTTLKPQMSFLFIPALLLWATWHGRRGFLRAFLVAAVLLAAASLALYPRWPIEFVGRAASYTAYTAYGSPIEIVTQPILGQLARPVELVVDALLLLCLAWQWRRLRTAGLQSGRFHWILGLTLILTNVVVPRTGTTNYVMLYMPLFFLLYTLLKERADAGWWLAGVYAVTLIGFWALFLVTVRGDFEAGVMYLPLPFGLLLAFLGWRRPLQAVALAPGAEAAT